MFKNALMRCSSPPGGVCGLIPYQSDNIGPQYLYMTNEQPRINCFMRFPNTKVEGYEDCQNPTSTVASSRVQHCGTVEGERVVCAKILYSCSKLFPTATRTPNLVTNVHMLPLLSVTVPIIEITVVIIKLVDCCHY